MRIVLHSINIARQQAWSATVITLYEATRISRSKGLERKLMFSYDMENMRRNAKAGEISLSGLLSFAATIASWYARPKRL